jgi:hypothetical protein
MTGEDSTMTMNRTVYEAELADISRDGKQIRIVKQRENASFAIEPPEYVETLNVEQARQLRDSLTEAIDRA